MSVFPISHIGYEVPKVGDMIDVWFAGYGTVQHVSKYKGRFQENFTHVLRVAAPNTKRGWMEVLFKLEHKQ